MEKMLVTKGLNELKLLDSRIHRKIHEGEFVGAAKVSAVNINGKTTKEAFKNNAKADYQSIMDLISRRNKIKKRYSGCNQWLCAFTEKGRKPFRIMSVP